MTSINVKVYWASLDDFSLPGVYRLDKFLDKDERRRAARLRKPKDGQLFRLAHGLLRHALSDHHNIPPEAWRFSREDGGRPRIERHFGTPDLRFSLSHGGGVAACVVSVGRLVGIDVECASHSRFHINEVAPSVLAPLELEALLELRGLAHQSSFFQFWTLKEAFTKALGLGLAYPFHRCAFRLNPARLIHADSVDTNSWSFEQWVLPKQRIMAVAAEHTSKERVNFTYSQVAEFPY